MVRPARAQLRVDGMITDSFFIKHIRPHGLELAAGYLADDGPIETFLKARLEYTQRNFDDLRGQWLEAASRDPVNPLNDNSFAQVGLEVASARWNELGETNYSTVFWFDYLDIQNINGIPELRPRQEFIYEMVGEVFIAVEVDRRNRTYAIRRNFDAIKVAANDEGIINHFGDLREN